VNNNKTVNHFCENIKTRYEHNERTIFFGSFHVSLSLP